MSATKPNESTAKKHQNAATNDTNNSDLATGQPSVSDKKASLTDSLIGDIEEILKDPEAVKLEKYKILKNLLLICFAFLCNFIAFQGTSSLQSSLNYAEGLGTASLSVIYAALILSAMFSPTIVIKWLGCKWTICASIVGYVTYSFANFYPHWGTLIPSSIIVGFAAAPLWSAKCAYLTTTAKRYARLTNTSTETVVNQFFGIFFLFFQFNNIIGQLISSFVLSSGDSRNLIFPSCFNASYIEGFCGTSDCQEDFNAARLRFNSTQCPITELQGGTTPPSLLYTLMGIYAAVALFGAGVVAVFVDPVLLREKETRGPFDLLIATFKHMKDYRQILLIAITMYSGFEQAFFTGDFTRSYISCPLAVNWVGFVLICYGACDSICSYLFGRLEEYTGILSLFTAAFVLNLISIIVFLAWIPYPSSQVAFFLLAAAWGISDAVWQTQLNALYGVIFLTNQEASFANYRLWESLGFVISFAYQNFLCVNTKLFILLAVLVVGMVLYCYVEFDRKKNKLKIEAEELEKVKGNQGAVEH